jgi:hypothetical protein
VLQGRSAGRIFEPAVLGMRLLLLLLLWLLLLYVLLLHLS